MVGSYVGYWVAAASGTFSEAGDPYVWREAVGTWTIYPVHRNRKRGRLLGASLQGRATCSSRAHRTEVASARLGRRTLLCVVSGRSRSDRRGLGATAPGVGSNAALGKSVGWAARRPSSARPPAESEQRSSRAQKSDPRTTGPCGLVPIQAAATATGLAARWRQTSRRSSSATHIAPTGEASSRSSKLGASATTTAMGFPTRPTTARR